jgi:outer membrane receptor protein involved in Fe transport
VEVSGAEVEFRFLLSEAVEIWGSIGLLDTKVVDAIDPLLNGNQTPRAPETSGSLGGKYSVPAGSGNFDALATWSYTDAFYFDLGNAFQQPSYSTVDARIAWSNPTWGIALAGENLADQEYLVDQFLFLDVTSQRGWGRLVRVELNLNF